MPTSNRSSRGQVALLPYHAHACGKGEIIYENRHHNIAAGAAIAAEEVLLLGTRFECEDGRMFVYVQQLTAAAPLGSVLESTAPVGEDTVSSSSDLMVIETGGVDTTWVAGAFAGDWVYVDAGTGEGQCRRILNNTTTDLYVDRALTTALAVADSDITIYRPFHTILATAAITTEVAAVASVINPDAGAGPGTSAIDLNSYGWVQVRGFCEHVLVDDTATIVGGYMCVDDAVAGTATDVGTALTLITQYHFAVARAVNVSTTIPADLIACTLGG